MRTQRFLLLLLDDSDEEEEWMTDWGNEGEERTARRTEGRTECERQRDVEGVFWSEGVNMINPLPTSSRDTSFSHFQPH